MSIIDATAAQTPWIQYRNRDYVCQWCGAVFRSRKAYSTYTPKYCSSKCCGNAQCKWSTCKQCGGPYRTGHSGVRNALFCSRHCYTAWRTGRSLGDAHCAALSAAKIGKPIPHLHNEAVRKKISAALTGKPQPWLRGPKHPNYKDGGKAAWARQKAMGRTEYKTWRRAVFERDSYTCRQCGQISGAVQAHHIKPWAKYPDMRYDVDNGVTLCKRCHIEECSRQS